MKTVISSYQTTLILIAVLVATTIIFLPSLLIERSAQDAWITMLLLIGYGIILALIYTPLCQRMGRVDIVHYSQKVLGKALTFPLTIILIIAFIFLCGTVVRETSEVLINAYMTNTPLWFFNGAMLFTIALITYYGLEVLARSLEVIFYIFLISYMLTFILLIDVISFDLLQPVLSRGITPLFIDMYPGLLFFSELSIILIIAPQITEKGNILKPLLTAVLVAGILLILPVLFSLMIFGPHLSKELIVPIVNLNSYIQKLMILERVDPLFIFYWVGGGIMKGAIFFYAAVYLAQKLFNLSTHYLFIPIILPFTFYISFTFFQNVAEIKSFLITGIPFYLAALVVYPVLLLLISIIRGVDFSDDKT